MNIPFVRESTTEHAAALIARFVGASHDTAGRLTDFNAGSNIRSFLETIARRFAHLDLKVWSALGRAMDTILFEFFGEGDGVTTSVGFPLLPATHASGLFRARRVADTDNEMTIAPGTTFTVPGSFPETDPKTYVAAAGATLAAGASEVDVLIRAVEPGVVGNTPAGTVQLADATGTLGNLDLNTSTNPTAFENGAAAETNEGRRVRFTSFIQNLARAQFSGLEVAARRAQVLVSGVPVELALFARAMAVPETRGLVSVYIDNGGGTATPELVADAQAWLDGFTRPDGTVEVGATAAGIVATAKAVTPQVQDIQVAIKPEAGFTYAELVAPVTAAITTHLFDLGVMEDIILWDLICAVQRVRGVEDGQILLPTANVSANDGQRFLAGTITVTAL